MSLETIVVDGLDTLVVDGLVVGTFITEYAVRNAENITTSITDPSCGPLRHTRHTRVGGAGGGCRDLVLDAAVRARRGVVVDLDI